MRAGSLESLVCEPKEVSADACGKMFDSLNDVKCMGMSADECGTQLT